MNLRDITVSPADEAGYGYILRASDGDWADIIELTGDEYLHEAYHDYDEIDRADLLYPNIGLHVDASQLATIFEALARRDLSRPIHVGTRVRIITDDTSYKGYLATVRAVVYDGYHVFLDDILLDGNGYITWYAFHEVEAVN